MLRKTLSLVMLAILVLAIGPSRADEMASIAYAKLATVQAAFAAMPEAARDRLILKVRVIHADSANHAPIRLWTDIGGTRTDIPLAEDGTIELPVRQDWIDQDVKVATDQPRGTLRISTDLTIRVPGGDTIPAAYLSGALTQAQAAAVAGARQMGGYMAQFLVPTMRSVQIKFATCCAETVTVEAGTGSTVLKQNDSGIVGVPAAALGQAGATLKLSAPATILDPSSD